MKKVLFININQIESISGIEKYCIKLAKIFNDLNWEVSEAALIKSNDESNELLTHRYVFLDKKIFVKKNKLFRIFTHRIFFEKQINKLLKQNKYDLIINNTNIDFKKISSNDNYIYVQHFDTKFVLYSNLLSNFKEKLRALIFKSLLFIFNQRTPILHSKNIVSPYDGFIQKKYLKAITNYFYIAIPYDNLKQNFDFNIQNKYKKNFLYLGRIDQWQKNILYLNEYFDNIDFYGDDFDKDVTKKLKDKYNGVLLDTQSIENVFNNHSFLIMSSFYEGFPLVMCEAFANGTPIICSNKITSKDFFLKDKKNGFELDIDKEPSELINRINNLTFDEYDKMCRSVFEFAQKYLSLEEFNKKWLYIISSCKLK